MQTSKMLAAILNGLHFYKDVPLFVRPVLLLNSGDLICGSMVSKATSLPTELPPMVCYFDILAKKITMEKQEPD